MATIDKTINGSRTRVFTSPPSSSTNLVEWRRIYRVKPDRNRSRKPKGVPMPPKPYSFEETVYRHKDGTIKVYQGSALWGYQVGTWTVVPSGAAPAVPLRLKQQAEIKALQELKGTRVNLGVALAEASATADLIGDSLSRIAKGYNALKRKDPKGALRALGFATKGDIPQRWLEYQYGINPLLADMKGAVDELISSPRSSWHVTCRGNARDTIETISSNSEWVVPCTLRTVDEVSAAVRLSYAPKNAALASIARLGMTNPFEIIWEKVPFSFVVDWALPVGDWLGVLDATVGWEFLHGSCTLFSRRNAYLSHPRQGTFQGGYTYTADGYQKASSAGVRFNRTVYVSSPVPEFPQVKNPVSLGRLANGLSLICAVFGRRPPGRRS